MVDGGRTAKLRGQVDLSNAGELGAALERLPDDGEDVALDVGELEFIDSSGLEELLWSGKRLNGGRLVLRGARRNLQQLLHVTGIDRLEWLSVRSAEGL